jgi:CRISPR/Cas system-associated exonuclease Cas4 (RecB family)
VLYNYGGKLLQGYEIVSDLNGIALPMYFVKKITGTLGDLQIQHILHAANQKLKIIEGYKYKYKQIQNYNWIGPETAEFIANNMAQYIKCGIFEVPLITATLTGFIDCISNNTVYEFKCVNFLDKTHFIQLALYMYLAQQNGINYTAYHLYNILSGEIILLKCTPQNLQYIYETLINAKKN